MSAPWGRYFFVAVRSESFVFQLSPGTPATTAEVFFACWILLEVPEVSVMRVAHADSIWRAFFYEIVWILGFITCSVRAGVVPQNEVKSLTGRDVICTVPPSSEVDDTGALLVVVGVAVLAMICCPDHAAELQAGTREFQPQAEIHRHVGVIRVHVQPEILAGPVPDI